jgi:hypothetical protein
MRTSSRKVWKAIGRMKRKSTRLPVQAFKKDSKLITNKKDVANLLAETISFNSSSDHYSTDFQKIKDQLETKACNFSSDNTECYNVPFSLSELKQALLKSNNSAPGLIISIIRCSHTSLIVLFLYFLISLTIFGPVVLSRLLGGRPL